MSERSDAVNYDVTCPHCRKRFTASLIEGAAARYRGFKCPHCKLFIPYERADEAEVTVRGTQGSPTRPLLN